MILHFSLVAKPQNVDGHDEAFFYGRIFIMPSRAKRGGELPSCLPRPAAVPPSLLLMVSVAASGPVLKTVEPQQAPRASAILRAVDSLK